MNGRLLGIGLLHACASTPEPERHPARDRDPADSGADAGDSGDTADTGAEPIESPDEVEPDGRLALCINEFMPDNQAALFTEDGAHPDWIELHNPSPADISLEGWTLGDDRGDPEPLPDLTVESGDYLLLYADGQPELGADHLNIALSSEGEELALFDPEGDGQVIVFGAVSADFAVARVEDCCTGPDCLEFRFRGTPGAPNGDVEVVEETVVAAGSAWSYWDTGTLPAESWASAAYDDSAWATGAAPLGFGDSHIVTTIDGGSEAARNPTTWFRHSFVAGDADVLTLSLMVDDGALVWLNGEEALRVNLPEGELSVDTLATTAVAEGDESSLTEHDIDPDLLVRGENVLAIEVHQASATSSDLTLDLALVVGTWE